MVGIGALPATMQFGMLVFLPETPRWLVKAGRKDDAKVVLKKVYGGHPTVSRLVDSVVGAIEREVKEEAQATSKRRDHVAPTKDSWVWVTRLRDGWAELFTVDGNRRALTIACMLQGLQQLCGFVSQPRPHPYSFLLMFTTQEFVDVLLCNHLFDSWVRRPNFSFSIHRNHQLSPHTRGLCPH